MSKMDIEAVKNDERLPVLIDANVNAVQIASSINEDQSLIDIYLRRKNDSGLPAYADRTIESYRRDLKRLQIYLELKGRSFKTMQYDDLDGFVSWLSKPGDEFIGEIRYPKDDERWRPFYRSGLSTTAIRQQMASVHAFFTWLRDLGYIDKNIFALQKKAKQPKVKVERHLREPEVQAVADYLNSVHEFKSARERAIFNRYRWLWYSYFLSGLRISELLNLTGSSLEYKKIWILKVVGKGRSEADEIAIPDRFIDELQRYRASLNLPVMPKKDEALLLTITGKHPVNCRATAHRIFKDLTSEVADHFKMLITGKNKEEVAKIEDPESVANIRRSSVHWLRHGFVTGLLDTTNDIATVSKMARHKDLRTTSVYSHADALKQHKILSDFAKSIK